MNSIESDTESFQDDVNKNILHVEPIDIRTSLSSLSRSGVSLDTVLKRCGDFGRFQLTHYCFLSLMIMCNPMIVFYYVFGAAKPNHRCRLPRDVWPNDTQYTPINQTHEMYINSYIPRTNDGKSWEQCVRYTTQFINRTLISCPEGWIYDRSLFGYTFTEEADFICQNEAKRSWLATAPQVGGFLLLIISSFADKYGRKKIIVVMTLTVFCISSTTQSIIRWIPMQVNTKFLLLLFEQFTFGLVLSTYSIIFILALELTSSAHTSTAGNLLFISSTMGQVLITLFAYVTRDWLNLRWAITLFIGLGLPYLYFMPESPLYIYAKGQYTELEATLRRIATRNGRSDSDWYLSYQDLLRLQPIKSAHKHQETMFLEKSHYLLIHRITITRLLLAAVIGFITLMIYVKMSYGLAAMHVSPYVAIPIGAFVEASSCIISNILLLSRLGRKGSFVIMMLLTMICLVVMPMSLKYSPSAGVIVAQFGKFFCSSTAAIAWIFVPEMFPTAIRSTSNGVFIVFSRLGAITTPVLDTTIPKDYMPYTYYVSGLLCFIVVLCSLMLPETKDKPMDDVGDYTKRATDI